jgi:hypothetical protein
MTDLGTLRHHQLAALLQQTFTIDAGDGVKVPATLVEVQARGQSEGHGSSGRQPFSAVFRARGDAVLPQRIYAVSNPVLGELHLFLVPIGPDEAGLRYEAVFA